MRIEFHPAARDELIESTRYYTEQAGPDVGRAFQRAVVDSVGRVAQFPLSWPRDRRGTRRSLLRTFPFAIVYHVDEDRIVVVAVAHLKRRPGYWIGRRQP